MFFLPVPPLTTTKGEALTMTGVSAFPLSLIYQILCEVVVNFLVFFRLYRRTFIPPRPLDGQVIVITGATRSMGKEAALLVASLGAKVVIPCRETSLGQLVARQIVDAGHPTPLVVEMDLCSLDSIAKAARTIKKKTSKVDALLNNAGAMPNSRQLTGDLIESTVQTNFVGQFLLTKALLPHLIKSPDPRVVFVSSLGHLSAAKLGINLQDFFLQTKYDWWLTYCQSKLASLMFNQQLAKEYKKVRFYSVDPGIAISDIARNFPSWAKFLDRIKIVTPLQRTTKQAGLTISGPLFLPKSSYDPNEFYYGDNKPKKCAELDDNLCQDVCQMTQELVKHHLLVS